VSFVDHWQANVKVGIDACTQCDQRWTDRSINLQSATLKKLS